MTQTTGAQRAAKREAAQRKWRDEFYKDKPAFTRVPRQVLRRQAILRGRATMGTGWRVALAQDRHLWIKDPEAAQFRPGSKRSRA